MSMTRPNGTYFTRRAAMIIVVVIWLYNLGVNLPQLVWADVVPSRRASLDCQMPYVSGAVLQLYAVIKSLVNFFAPLLVTWFSYVGIVIRACQSRSKVGECQILLPHVLEDIYMPNNNTNSNTVSTKCIKSVCYTNSSSS